MSDKDDREDTAAAGSSERVVSAEARRIAAEIANANNEDVILYNGPLYEPVDSRFIEECRAKSGRPNALLILVTGGGSIDAAYRIAVAMQDNYQRFRVFVPGVCKSAGTLIVVGAHGLVMNDQGQLGPLDVQLGYGGSGLNVPDALEALNDLALKAFNDFYENLTNTYDGLQSDTAMSIATDLTVGLYSHAYAQVDLMHLGESHRAMLIAAYYGARLLEVGRNIDQEDGLDRLVWDYVSHGFVINRQEASYLFHRVEGPSELEAELASELDELALEERSQEDAVLEFLATADTN